MVLLHPVNGSSLYWRSVVADLARDREVYALDTIGTGRAQRADRAATGRSRCRGLANPRRTCGGPRSG